MVDKIEPKFNISTKYGLSFNKLIIDNSQEQFYLEHTLKIYCFY